MDRVLAPTLIEASSTFPEPVLMLLLPATVSAARVTSSLDVLNVPFRVVGEVVLTNPPLNVSVSPPSPSVTMPLLKMVTGFVMTVVVPSSDRLDR